MVLYSKTSPCYCDFSPKNPCKANELIPELGLKDQSHAHDASTQHNNNNVRHKSLDNFIKLDDVPFDEGRQDGFEYIVAVGSLSGRLRPYHN